MPTLGEKNKNPWNVKNDMRDPWLGSMGQDKKGHAIFVDNSFSARAVCRTLAQKFLGGKRSVIEIFESYAPRDDGNDPVKYAKFVCSYISDLLRQDFNIGHVFPLFKEDGKIGNEHILRYFMEAMAKYENYADYEVNPLDVAIGMMYFRRDFKYGRGE